MVESSSFKNLLFEAGKIAKNKKAHFIGVEHVLAAYCKLDSSSGSLIRSYISYDQITSLLLASDCEENNNHYSSELIDLISKTKIYLKSIKEKYITAISFLYFCVCINKKNKLYYILDQLNVDIKEFSLSLISLSPDIGNLNNKSELTNNFEKVNNNTIDDSFEIDKILINMSDDSDKYNEVIGRDSEIETTIEILSRRAKNNPMLIGKPGVGKTAIVEGLVKKIKKESVPNIIKDKKIMSLSLAALISNTQYRGDFENKIIGLIDYLKANKNIILFIDEIHTILGVANSDQASPDITNYLKPLLARGEISVIGATTLDEYRKIIKKDPAFDRRFNIVSIEELSVNESISVLNHVSKKLQKHHNVEIQKEAIDDAVILSEKYINDRTLPDKAIDILDQACSRANINRIPIVDSELIKNVVSKLTKIPVDKINKNNKFKIEKLEKNIRKEIVGQDFVINSVLKVVKRSMLNLSNPKKPLASFLFIGPTGVGKTEIANLLAKNMFDTEKNMLRLDMSEYSEKVSVNKLIGSAPGYIGYEDSGILTEFVSNNPYSLILFDEIEKAHLDIFNILLQILDAGRLSDNKGKVINFKNTFIVCTSNLGARQTNEYMIKTKKDNISETYINSLFVNEIKKSLKPELINRFDQVIPFRYLDKTDAHKIAEIEILKMAKKLKEENLYFTISKSAIVHIINSAFNRMEGARNLQRAFQTHILDRIINLKINERINKNQMISIDCVDENLMYFKKEIHKKK